MIKLPRFFTTTELMRLCGEDEELVKNPNFTRLLADELRRRGYTKRADSEYLDGRAIAAQSWSRAWVGERWKEQASRANQENRKRIEDTMERIKKVLDNDTTDWNNMGVLEYAIEQEMSRNERMTEMLTRENERLRKQRGL